MNKKRIIPKRILALLCAITMVVTFFPAGIFQDGAYAADENAADAVATDSQNSESTDQAAASDNKDADESAAPVESAEPESKVDAEDSADKKETAQPKSDTYDKDAAKAGSQENDADKAAGKEETEKHEESEKTVSYEASFDLTANYAHFNPISATKTDESGKVQLPKKPEARKELYKAADGKEYYFTGWELNGKEYDPGDTAILSKDSKFRAVWKQTYTVEFSAKGIKADEVESQVEVYGEPVVLPSQQASKPGLDFIGWTPDNGKTVYEAGTSISPSRIQPLRSVSRIKLMAETEDATDPVINIELIKINKSEGKITGATYKVSATDNGSGLESIQTSVTDKESIDEESDEAVWWIDEDLSKEITREVPAGNYLYVVAKDNDGNTATDRVYVEADKLEGEKPEITVDDTEKEKAAEAAKAHIIKFAAKDMPEDEDQQSGLSYIRVYSDNEEFEEMKLPADATEVELNDTSLNGKIIVHLEAYDNCNNRSDTVDVTCLFDNTDPRVDSVTMQDGIEYFNAANCSIKVVASDDTGVKSVKVSTVDGIELGTSEAGESDTTVELSISEGTVADKLGEVDKKIELLITVEDAVGNTNEGVISSDTVLTGAVSENDHAVFNYDNIAPQLQTIVTTASSDIYYEDTNAYYYGEAANTVYTFSEDVSGTLQYKYDGEDASSDFESSEEVTGEWSKDGTYSDIILSSVVDKAGNKLAAGTDTSGEDAYTVADGSAKFTYAKAVDTKNPTAVVTYDTNATPYLYDEEGTPTVYANETFTASIVITDNGKELDSSDYKDYKVNDFGAGELAAITTDKISLSSPSDDGEYEIKLCGADRAGHPLEVKEVMQLDKSSVKTGTWPADAVQRDIDLSEDDAALQVKFVVDTKAPEYISTEFSAVGNADAVEGNTAYYNEDIHGAFDITEENFDRTRIGASIISKKGGDDDQYSDIEPEWPDDITAIYGKGFASDHKYEVSVDANKENEGVYRFIISGEDKAGNKLERSGDTSESGSDDYNSTEKYQDGAYQSMKKVIDVTAPEWGMKIYEGLKTSGYYVRYSNSDKVRTQFYGDEKYEPFRKNETATIVVKGDDKSPVKIEYSLISTQPKSNNKWEKEESTKSQFGNNQEAEITKKGETQFRVTGLVVTDRAGNKSEPEFESNTVYLDGTAPDRDADIIKPEVKIYSTEDFTARIYNQPIYNDTVTLSFEVTDPNEHKSSSGLKRIWYTAVVDGNKVSGYTDVEPVEIEAVKPDKLGKNDEGLTFKKKGTITIPKGKDFESNNISVTLYAEDNSGNTGRDRVDFGIDSVGPVIVVNVSGKSVRGNKYFNSNRTARVTVTERNLGSGSNKVQIKTEVGTPKNWTYKEGSKDSGNDDKWIKTFKYTKDGDYTLKVSGTDALGNPAKISYNGEHPKKFTVDKTKPVIRVTFDNNNVRNGKYYKANRTATVAIDEHNFDPKDVKVTSTISKGPRNVATSFPGISGFSSRGDSRTATIPFNKEGNFAFNVNFTDKAGNAATVVKIDEFVIDKTAPVVRIENVVNGGIYGGTVAPRAVFDDDTFSRNDSSFRFSGIRNAEAALLVPGFSANGEYGGSYVMNDFPHIRRNDDVYTAYATSTDMAGNSTTVQVTFSVNRFGSSYDYNNDNATVNLVSKEKGKYYTNEPQALQIREFNVNHIKSYALTLDRGGNTVKLKEGKDYTVVKSDADAGTTYVYKINKEIITDEGSYNIIVKSEDEAGNVNSNAAMRSEDEDYEVPLRFVYDTTAPTMTFKHYNSNGVIELKVDEKNKFRNTDVLDLGIVPNDDWSLAAIRFVLTGKDGVIKDSGIINGEEFWKVMGKDGVQKFLQEVPHGSSIKTLEVTVWDAAGNETTTTYKLSVTKNAAETALANWYWILLALAGAGTGGYAYYRHRRNDDDEEEGEDDAA